MYKIYTKIKYALGRFTSHQFCSKTGGGLTPQNNGAKKGVCPAPLSSKRKGFTQHHFFGIQKSGAGFTLLEMILALGIFIILFTLTLGIYSATLKTEQRSLQISRLQTEAQLIMEVLAKKIRSSKVDYSYYPSNTINTSGEPVLALLDRNNNPTIFRWDANNSISICTGNCGTYGSANEGSFYNIPSENINVTSLIFFINPATNPFSLNAPPDEFPKITVVINLQSNLAGVSQDLLVQQTIPQRLAGP